MQSNRSDQKIQDETFLQQTQFPNFNFILENNTTTMTKEIENQYQDIGEKPIIDAQNTEMMNLYGQILEFYDKNINNLKIMVVQKDLDLKAKDEKIRELNTLIYQMKNSFSSISQKYEQENSELRRRYLLVMEEQKKNQSEQKYVIEKEQLMNDYLSLKQQLLDLNSQKISNDLKLKEMELKNQADIRLIEELSLKLEQIQNELTEMIFQKNTLQNQNTSLQASFDSQKDNYMLEQQRSLQIQEQLSIKIQFLQQQNITLQHQLQQSQLANLNQNYINHHQFQTPMLYSNGLNQTTQPQFYQNTQLPQNNGIQQNTQQPSQNNFQQQNNQGIIVFPSDQKYYNQIDEINALHKDLQDLGQRKAQLESELNKRVIGGKTFNEKRKRELQEKEVDEITDQLNKIKLKLREFKQN